MKNSIKITIALSFIIFQISILNAQTQLVASGGNLVMDGNYLVVENSKLINNSTFQLSDGTVVVSGDATNANSEIGGSSITTFYNLQINKTANGTQLGNDISISNQLTLTSGNIDIVDYDLTIENTGTLSGGSSSSYIQTSSLGTMVQEVGATNITFPVGNQSYTPVTLNNAGTTDDFNVRVENTVYQDGTSGNAITTDAVNVTWHIDEVTSGGSDISATFQWNASDELTDFDRTQSFISYYDNSQWNNGTVSAASGSNPYTLTESGISTLSSFIVASDAAVLPVELLYFYGEKEGENVRLSWETATEIDNDYFDVEWSTDGISFEKIGEVAGAGTTREIQFYDFLHNLSRHDLILYYRLKQVDFDGKHEYTNIILIKMETANNLAINIYPNPTTDFINIETNQTRDIAQIIDIQGQVVKEFQLENMNEQYSIQELSAGTYLVKIGTEIKKLIIQK